MPFFFFTTSLVSAQFNTLMPPKRLVKENIPLLVPPIEETVKHGKKMRNKILNRLTTYIRKDEFDSLQPIPKAFRYVPEIGKVSGQQITDALRGLTNQDPIKRTKEFESRLTQNFIKKLPEEVSKVSMPLGRKMIITSPYGTRVHPVVKSITMHNGMDLKAEYENVYTVLDGIITESGWDPKGGGKFIKINHYNRFETAYLHLSEIYYQVGEKVHAGFIIAKSGNTGNSTGPHLHFAVRELGQTINPLTFLNDLIKANYLTAKNYAN